jgi:hypothetical protein
MTLSEKYMVQDLHLVDLEDFRYGGTNITAFRLVDPNNPLVQEVVRYIWRHQHHRLPPCGPRQLSRPGGRQVGP